MLFISFFKRNKMKKTTMLPLFLFATYLMVAQQPTTRQNDGRVNLLTSQDRFQFINPFDDRLINVRGTRFFFDSTYRSGELQTTKTLYTTELKYRFDQIERMVQVKLENGKELWLNEKDVVYFKLFIDDKVVDFVPALIPNGRKSMTLLQVIYKSPTMQLLRDSRKYIFRVKSDNIDGYSSEEVYDEVRKDYRYFFNQGESAVFTEVKTDAKSFIKLMPTKRSQISKLFKAAQTKDGLNITKLSAILKELDKKEEVTQ
jgi:hypothetical protein